MNGGGGKGVLCKNNGQESLETLDLYEGRLMYDLTYEKYLDRKDYKDLVLDLMTKHLNSKFVSGMNDEQYKNILNDFLFKKNKLKLKFLNSGKHLKSTQDSADALMDKNCQLVQIAMFYDESVILIDSDLWNKLSVLDQAALIAHEMFYYHMRAKGETNSVSSRKLIAYMFSDQGIRPKLEGFNDKYLDCDIKNVNSNANIGSFFIVEGEDYDNSFSGEKSKGLVYIFEEFGALTKGFRVHGVAQEEKLESFFDKNLSFGHNIDLIKDTYNTTHVLEIEKESSPTNTQSFNDRYVDLKLTLKNFNKTDINEFKASCVKSDNYDSQKTDK